MKPIASTAGTAATVAALLTLLAGCGEEDTEPNRDPGAKGALAAVTTFADALESGESSRACAHLAASAQRALEKAQGASNCIDALSRAHDAGGALSVDIDSDDVEVSGDKATVSGDSADELAGLFGADSLSLVREEGRWMLA